VIEEEEEERRKGPRRQLKKSCGGYQWEGNKASGRQEDSNKDAICRG